MFLSMAMRETAVRRVAASGERSASGRAADRERGCALPPKSIRTRVAAAIPGGPMRIALKSRGLPDLNSPPESQQGSC